MQANRKTCTTVSVTVSGRIASQGSAKYIPETGRDSDQTPGAAVRTMTPEIGSGFS